MTPRQAPPGVLPECPLPLAEHGARLWDGVTASYELSPHELELLGQAAVLLDYIMLVDGRLASRLDRALLRVQYEQRRQFMALIAALRLPDPSAPAMPLPDDVTRLPRREAASGQG